MRPKVMDSPDATKNSKNPKLMPLSAWIAHCSTEFYPPVTFVMAQLYQIWVGVWGVLEKARGYGSQV
jgi:hypothetical protein